MVSPRLLKMRQVKERLPLSTGTLYGLVNQKKLASVRVGKTVMVPEDALEDFIQRCTTEAMQD